MMTGKVTICLALGATVLIGGAGCDIAADDLSVVGKYKAAVPDDCVQPLGFKVAEYPTFEELAAAFKRAHQQSEKIYNGDGSWGKGYGDRVKPPVYHPLVRHTARRVLGYIDAYLATGVAIYKQRAKEGLEYLLKEQQSDGHFIWWHEPKPRVRVGEGTTLYVTAIPAAAFVEGYKLFKDKKYLEAANKACDYICTVSAERGAHPHVFVNTNAHCNLFASWALAVNYKVTRNEFYLDRAIHFAWTVIYRQLPSGMLYGSHDEHVCYHGAILRGLAMLLSVMPKDDPHRHKIKKATYRALNHLRARQRADGYMLLRPKGRYGWRSRPTCALGVIVTQLDWEVMDSLRLAAKGARGSGGIMATGSLMRAYKQVAKAGR